MIPTPHPPRVKRGVFHNYFNLPHLASYVDWKYCSMFYQKLRIWDDAWIEYIPERKT